MGEKGGGVKSLMRWRWLLGAAVVLESAILVSGWRVLLWEQRPPYAPKNMMGRDACSFLISQNE
jgi:hypothetical protein